MKHTLISALAVALLGSVVLAQEAKPGPTLKMGDPAPALKAAKWIKGGPVESFEKGKVYVVECWATWCGPCIMSMPHVTELQAKYKDKGVVVIGMNVWERDESKVEPFVKTNDAKMGYIVAMDDKSKHERGDTATNWLTAAGRNGIPCSFIVDQQGKIAWIGHPMQMDRPLELIVAGKFDVAAEALIEAKNQEAARKSQELAKELSQAMRDNNHDKAMELVDAMSKANPAMAGSYEPIKVSIFLRKGDYAAANALVVKLAEGDAGKNSMSSARLAAMLLSAPDQEKIDAALALKLAQQAYDLSTDKGWQYSSLLAKALAANKQYGKAVELQTKAVEAAPEQAKSREQKALDDYKAKATK